VVGVMIVTSSFLTLVMLMIWQTHLFLVVIFVTVFGAIEFTYFSAVLYKFPQGGYLPLAFAALLLLVMYVWHYVHVKRYAYEVEQKVSTEYILSLGSSLGVTKVPGIGLLYTELAQGVPAIFAHFMRNLPAIHSVLVFVCVKYLPVNTIPAEERIRDLTYLVARWLIWALWTYCTFIGHAWILMMTLVDTSERFSWWD
jgi:KUP system potassium uptake protein